MTSGRHTPSFEEPLTVDDKPSPRSSRGRPIARPPLETTLDSSAAIQEILGDIGDIEEDEKDLLQRYEVEKRGRIAAEARIQELLEKENEQKRQLQFMGETIEGLKDNFDSGSFRALKHAAARASLSLSTKSSIAGLHPDQWSLMSGSRRPRDAESRSDAASSVGTDNVSVQNYGASDSRVVTAALYRQEISNLESKIQQQHRLQYQSQKHVERLEEQIACLEEENERLRRQANTDFLEDALAYQAKLYRAADSDLQSSESPRAPRRPAFDRFAPGGVPETARGTFISESEFLEMYIPHLFNYLHVADHQDHIRELTLRMNLHHCAIYLGGSSPSLAKALVSSIAAAQVAVELNNTALLGRCAFYRGRAEYGLSDWNGALVSFKEARACKGRYIEGEDLSKWILRIEKQLQAPEHDRVLSREVDDQDPSMDHDLPKSPDLTKTEREQIKISMKRWALPKQPVFDTEYWLAILGDSTRAASITNELKIAAISVRLDISSEREVHLELDSPGVLLEQVPIVNLHPPSKPTARLSDLKNNNNTTDELQLQPLHLVDGQQVHGNETDIDELKSGQALAGIIRKQKPDPTKLGGRSDLPSVRVAGSDPGEEGTLGGASNQQELENNEGLNLAVKEDPNAITKQQQQSLMTTEGLVEESMTTAIPSIRVGSDSKPASNIDKQTTETQPMNVPTVRVRVPKPGRRNSTSTTGLGQMFSANGDSTPTSSSSAQQKRSSSGETSPRSAGASPDGSPPMPALSVGGHSSSGSDRSNILSRVHTQEVIPAASHGLNSEYVPKDIQGRELGKREHDGQPGTRPESPSTLINDDHSHEDDDNDNNDDLYSAPSPAFYRPALAPNPRPDLLPTTDSPSIYPSRTPSPPHPDPTPPPTWEDNIRTWLSTQRTIKHFVDPNSPGKPSLLIRRQQRIHLPGYEDIFAAADADSHATRERPRPSTARADLPLRDAGFGFGFSATQRQGQGYRELFDAACDYSEQRPHSSGGLEHSSTSMWRTAEHAREEEKEEEESPRVYQPPEMSPRMPPLPRSAGLLGEGRHSSSSMGAGGRKAHRRQSSLVGMLRGFLGSPLRRTETMGQGVGDEEAVAVFEESGSEGGEGSDGVSNDGGEGEGGAEVTLRGDGEGMGSRLNAGGEQGVDDTASVMDIEAQLQGEDVVVDVIDAAHAIEENIADTVCDGRLGG